MWSNLNRPVGIFSNLIYLLFNPTYLSVISLGMLSQHPVSVPGGGATLRLNRSFCPAVDITGRNVYTKDMYRQLFKAAGGLPDGYNRLDDMNESLKRLLSRRIMLLGAQADIRCSGMPWADGPANY